MYLPTSLHAGVAIKFSVFVYMVCAGLTDEARPRNDDIVPMRLAQTLVIDRIQLAVYCLSNFLPGKALAASRQGHKGDQASFIFSDVPDIDTIN